MLFFYVFFINRSSGGNFTSNWEENSSTTIMPLVFCQVSSLTANCRCSSNYLKASK